MNLPNEETSKNIYSNIMSDMKKITTIYPIKALTIKIIVHT